MQTRKELSKGNVRSNHANWGYLLLGLGVLTGVEGPVNTYLRAGEHSSLLKIIALAQQHLELSSVYAQNIIFDTHKCTLALAQWILRILKRPGMCWQVFCPPLLVGYRCELRLTCNIHIHLSQHFKMQDCATDLHIHALHSYTKISNLLQDWKSDFWMWLGICDGRKAVSRTSFVCWSGNCGTVGCRCFNGPPHAEGQWHSSPDSHLVQCH